MQARSGALAPGSQLAGGKYVIVGTLGEGGFGITYQATDTTLGRSVAIKELYPNGSERDGERITVPLTYTQSRWGKAVTDFLREARTIASLDHPGIVTVYEYFEQNNTAYMVMKFIDGVNLSTLTMQRGGRLPEAEALRYISEAGEALAVLHENGVLHRDIKPSNIMVNRQGHAVLIDFGAAREFVADQSMTHTVVASYGFAPPEQFHVKGRRGPYTDIYSLAATCYYLLTGNLPTAEADEETKLPPPIMAVLEHAMAYDPDHRPQNVAAFLAELRTAAGLGATISYPDPITGTDLPPTQGGLTSWQADYLRGPSQPPPASSAGQTPNSQASYVGQTPNPPAANSYAGQTPNPPYPAANNYAYPSQPPSSPAIATPNRRGFGLALAGGGIVVLAGLVALVIFLVGNGGGKGGGSGTPGPAALTSPTGGSGVSSDPTTARLYNVSMLSASEGWAVGDNVIVHYTADGGAVARTTFGYILHCVYLYSSDEGWAVGDGGVILHYRNGEWARQDSPVSNQNLVSLYMVASDEGWAGGDKGAMLHYKAGNWSLVQADTKGAAINGLYMLSADDGWAVGNGGLILRYSGGQWTTQTSPTADDLRSVYMTSTDDGWAVGEKGNIVHYSGGKWSAANTDHNANLYGVYMTAPDDGWAVGSYGLILHYSGGQLNTIASPTQAALICVYMTSADDGWAVGDGGTILHYSGGKWTLLPISLASSGPPTAPPATDTVAPPLDTPTSAATDTPAPEPVASNTPAPATSPTLPEVQAAPTLPPAAGFANVYLHSVAMTSASEGWAVGEVDDPSTKQPTGGALIHYSGGKWQPISTVPMPLYRVAMVTPAEGWAVGGSYNPQDQGLILHYVNNGWSEVKVNVNGQPVTTLLGLYMVSKDEGWAVGGGFILHYSNGQWSAVDNPVSDQGLTSVYMLSKDEGWAVGGSGSIIHYSGGKWSKVDSGSTATLNDVYMTSVAEGWAVGGLNLDNTGTKIRPVVIHYHDGHWNDVPIAGDTPLQAVGMVSGDEGWAAGSYGAGLWRYKGGQWTVVESTYSIAGLHLLSASDGWAVGGTGDRARILRYQNSEWADYQP